MDVFVPWFFLFGLWVELWAPLLPNNPGEDLSFEDACQAPLVQMFDSPSDASTGVRWLWCGQLVRLEDVCFVPSYDEESEVLSYLTWWLISLPSGQSGWIARGNPMPFASVMVFTDKILYSNTWCAGVDDRPTS